MTLAETKPRLFAFITLGSAVFVLALAVLLFVLVCIQPLSRLSRRNIEPDRPPGSSAIATFSP